MHDLPCKHLQCDEIWSFVYGRGKNVPEEHKGESGYGDVWTWTAICADTKPVPSWYVADRNGHDAAIFISDLASRLAHRVQLTTDGHKAYLEAVEAAFGAEIDCAMLIKLYGPEPAKEHISTSYAEHQNLTMRMSMRRFTRLTNAFPKKLENPYVRHRSLSHALQLRSAPQVPKQTLPHYSGNGRWHK